MGGTTFYGGGSGLAESGMINDGPDVVLYDETRVSRNEAVARFLQTLRRLPDDIVLELATREFNMQKGPTCLCGWAARAALGRIAGRSAEEVMDAFPLSDTVHRFGGTYAEWDLIFWGVTTNNLPLIEEAFALRLDEAVLGLALELEAV